VQLPNWFKVLWWLALTGVLSAFLYFRYPDLISGKSTPADIVVFIIWVALLLAPLFKEVSLLGITLKQEIEELKGFLVTQVSDIRSEVRNAVDVRTTFSPHFTLPMPAADSQLPELETRIKAVLSDAFAAQGLKASPVAPALPIPEDVSFLFATRYNIERELRRIVQTRELFAESRRSVPVFQLARFLTESEVIEPRLANAIREVYAVCSLAIHGEAVSKAKVSFVKDVGPDLVAALKAIG
jgi:hypothetical protein